MVGRRRRLSIIWILSSQLLFDSTVRGQTTNATCINNSTTSWLFNQDGESPCLVWSRIQSLCLSSDSFVNVPPLLDPSWGYNPPPADGTASLCQCNAVSYNLMGGCSFCQVGQAGDWGTEQSWVEACGEGYAADGLGFVEVAESIPAFAWTTWSGQKWSPAEASSSALALASHTPSGTTTLFRSFSDAATATATSSSGTPIPSTASSSTSRSGSSSGSKPNSTAAASPSSSSGAATAAANKWGPIVGGIVGGIIGLVLLFLLFRHYLNRNRLQNDTSRSTGTYPDTMYKSEDGGEKPRSWSRSQSFLSMFGARDRDMKRETEFIIDPMTFADPRPAPKAPKSSSSSSPVEGSTVNVNPISSSGKNMRYTTTQQRLRAKSVVTPKSSNSDTSDSSDDSPTLPKPTGQETGRRLIVRNSTATDLTSDDDSPREARDTQAIENENELRRIIKGRDGLHSPPSQDFSQPRPFSEVRTLPSLYDPPTNAPRYTMNGDMSRSPAPMSPESRYPATERESNGSTIGEALGSGGHGSGYWSRQKLPPLPSEQRGQ